MPKEAGRCPTWASPLPRTSMTTPALPNPPPSHPSCPTPHRAMITRPSPTPSSPASSQRSLLTNQSSTRSRAQAMQRPLCPQVRHTPSTPPNPLHTPPPHYGSQSRPQSLGKSGASPSTPATAPAAAAPARGSPWPGHARPGPGAGSAGRDQSRVGWCPDKPSTSTT